jgi:hypothetical protein
LENLGYKKLPLIISASIQDRNEIPTANPPFSGSTSSLKLTATLSHATEREAREGKRGEGKGKERDRSRTPKDPGRLPPLQYCRFLPNLINYAKFRVVL